MTSATLLDRGPARHPASGADPARLAELARRLARHTSRPGVVATTLARLSLIRFTAPGEELVHATHPPAVCVIAQGAKRVRLRDEEYRYDASHFLVFSTELPISAQVIEASAEAPYLCLRLDLDPAEVADLVHGLGARAPRAGTGRGLFLSRLDDAMLDATLRLVGLLDAPEDAAALAPLAMRELVYRVLRSEQGERLAQVARADSRARRVGEAVAWLKQHATEPLRVEALAAAVHMSPSALHRHFRAVTAMSPLQYQKQLRLQEARRLLLAEGREVAQAAWAVGYESASQFSREYRRVFGLAPSADAQRARDAVIESALGMSPSLRARRAVPATPGTPRSPAEIRPAR